MALQLIDAITDGTRRVLTRTGGILLVLLLAQQLLLVTSINTLLAAEIPPEAANVIGLTIPVSGTVAGAILLGTVVFSGVYFVVLSRAFARPLPQLSSFITGGVTPGGARRFSSASHSGRSSFFCGSSPFSAVAVS